MKIRINRLIIGSTFLFLLLFLLITIQPIHSTPNSVMVYTSHHQIHFEPVLNAFEQKTGVKIKALYDVEAAKTTDIGNRFLAEKNHPHCDGFWGSAGKQLFDYLLSTAVEKNPAFSPTAQIPVHPNVAKPPNMPSIDAIKTMAVSYEAIANQTENAAQCLKDTFLR